MPDVLKFSIPGKPEYVQMVRLAIASVAGKANYDVDAVEDIKEAVAEGCKFVFCHGFSEFSNAYEITCEIREDSMIIDLADSCSGHGLIKNNKPCRDCPSEGELAVTFMESLMDVVTVDIDRDGNKKIRMVKNR